ncbi:hypothetical protein KR018_011443 [Drosophila ironensis]|nr:hypothetical protein KR018_011443 [Drosophila ironensis]
MKLSIRTLDQRTISVEMSEKQDVGALKKRLSDMPEVAMPAESQQLIYGGRIMEDALPLREYQVCESKFIVLMRKKSVPAASEEQVPPTPPLTAANSEARTQPAPGTAQVSIKALAPASTSQPPTQATIEQRVRDLMAMGYEEPEVRDAMRASFNHPERAIEYLITGIPPHGQEQISASTANAAAATSSASAQASSLATSLAPSQAHAPFQAALADSASEASPSIAQATQNLHPLLSDPRFARVREMVRQNPNLLEMALASLAESDATLLENLREMLAGELATVSEWEAESVRQQEELTEEERAAVQRLVSLGFRRDIAVQAYLACDKDEELAADILFRQSEDED